MPPYWGTCRWVVLYHSGYFHRCQGLGKRVVGSSCVLVSTGEVRAGKEGVLLGLLREEESFALWGSGACAESSPASHYSLRVGRGASGQEASGAAGAEVLLSKCWLSGGTVCAMKQEDPNSRDKVRAKCPSPQLLMAGRGIVRRLCVAKTSERGMQELPQGRVPPLLGKWGPGQVVDTCRAPMPAMFPSPKAQALPFSQLGRDRAGPRGQSHRDSFTGLQRCSLPAAFALSLPACMLCCWAEADPDICGCKTVKKGLCAHTYCLLSSPRARSFMAGMVPSLPI